MARSPRLTCRRQGQARFRARFLEAVIRAKPRRGNTSTQILCLTALCAPLMARLSASMRRVQEQEGQTPLASAHRVRPWDGTSTQTLRFTGLGVSRKSVVTHLEPPELG